MDRIRPSSLSLEILFILSSIKPTVYNLSLVAKMVNIGQLVRKHAGDKKAALVGFGTYQGTVIAAKEWGEKMQKMHVPPAVDGSWDSMIHEFSKASR
jgi:erythromycin esterase-like protein